MQIIESSGTLSIDLETADQSQKISIALGGRAKRNADFALALIGLIVISPLFLLLSFSIRNLSPGPSLFGHKRIGLNGKEFECLKFRTMVNNGDEVLELYLSENPDERCEWNKNRKLKNDPRVTWLGAVLRTFSVDELPQLINVLRGEMSLVGPRPVVTEELEKYGDAAELYLCARPGITGLWQVSGRSNLSYDQRIELDSAYVQNWSMGQDSKILLKTIPSVLSAVGSY